MARATSVEALKKRQAAKNRRFDKQHNRRTKRSSGKRLARSKFGDFMVMLVLVIFAVAMGAPLLFVVSTAFKPIEELFLFPPRFFPINPTFRNFTDLGIAIEASFMPFSRYLFNSIFIAVTSTGGHVIIASMCAFPLALHKFRYRNAIFQIIVLSLMFSGFVIGIPRFMLMNQVGMLDSYWAVILPAIGGSLGLYLMKQFMEQIPASVLESARIDGAGEMRVLWQIVMPMVKPAWLTLILFSFNASWGDSYSAGLYLQNAALRPVPMLQRYIAAGGIMRAGAGSAFGLIMLLPPIITFIITQSNVIETMKSSGLKE
ncbi:MAG: carbohydrate ABC transporter permease [Defluviitaleaceae bacterium]|jgi:ABC-type glycerol-3-phosphate transport system permease component|nr:carbohydrate ABC transporter permease [Defluviitaleaceae bacterium]